jgi:hypothetical protein
MCGKTPNKIKASVMNFVWLGKNGFVNQRVKIIQVVTMAFRMVFLLTIGIVLLHNGVTSRSSVQMPNMQFNLLCGKLKGISLHGLRALSFANWHVGTN